VIMLTGFGDFMNATEERPAGVDLVVNKPVSLQDLSQDIVRIVSRRPAALLRHVKSA
jgi:FixJ family two-component response regulator